MPSAVQGHFWEWLCTKVRLFLWERWNSWTCILFLSASHQTEKQAARAEEIEGSFLYAQCSHLKFYCIINVIIAHFYSYCHYFHCSFTLLLFSLENIVNLTARYKKGDEKARKEQDETGKEETSTEKKEETENKDSEKITIFYVTDAVQQSQYINMFREAGKNAVILSHNIDTTFISHLEQKDQTIQFKRIDADVTEELKGDGAADEETAKTLTELFRKNLNMEKLEVKVENLKNESVAAMMTLSEESRRMQDMMKMYNMYGMDPGMFGGQETLVLNVSHPLVKYLAENQESEHSAVICQQLYDLAMLSHKQLSPDEMTKFVQRSNDILSISFSRSA